MIDCLRRRIVTSAPDMKYFALSYVWGNQQVEPTELSFDAEGDDLPQDLSQTLADAVDLVVSLGCTYLWVDRSCINQGDPEENRQQILCMDEIYESAFATIVAANSTGFHSGIAGVSVPRTLPLHVSLFDGLYLQGSGILFSSLVRTEWNRRSWTYQEFCLSRRCIVLAHDQMYFICRNGRTCEAVVEPRLSAMPFLSHRCVEPSILMDSIENDYEGRSAPYPDPAFARHLSSYTRRYLSYDGDMLNTLRGILTRSPLA